MMIPIPQYNEPEKTEAQFHSEEEAIRMKAYLNVPSWKCTHCKATMFGRMTYCVYCKLRLGIDTPRPQ